MTAIFDSTSYRWSLWALPTLATAVTMLAVATYVLARERASRESRIFALLSLVIVVWLGGFSGMYLASRPEAALVWARAAYLGIAFIPVCVWHFALAVTRVRERRPRGLWTAWGIGALFCVGMVGTDALVGDLYHYAWGFYPRFRWLGLPYLVYFGALLVLALGCYRRDLAAAEDETHRQRTRWLMLGFAVAYGASVDFVAAYGLPVYPFGYLCVLAFVVIAARTIRRYRLVDFTPELVARDALTAVPDPLLVCDRSGRVRLLNRAVTAVLGYGEDEILGRPLTDLAAAADDGGERLRRLLALGQGREEEVSLRGRDGAAIPLEIAVSPLVDPGGVTVGAVLAARDLRDRKSAEAALRANEELYRSLTEDAPAAIWVVEGERVRYSNRAAQAMTGYGAKALAERSFWDLLEPEARTALREAAAAGAAAHAPLRREVRLANRWGSERWVDLTLSPIARAAAPAITATAFDIHQMKLAEDAAVASERRLREMLETVQLVAVMLDRNGVVTFCNPYGQELLGYEPDEILGRNWFQEFLPEETRADAERDFLTNLAAGTVASYDESDLLTRARDRRWISWSNTLLRDRQGRVLGAASIGADITERKRAEERLVHEALHDALTGLPNRALFLDRLRSAIARGRRRGSFPYAVLFLDLDRFKTINDSLGHLLGDQLLIQVARRLQESLRPGDTIARLGGDEFTILLEDLEDAAEAGRVADRIRGLLAAPFDIQGHEAFTSASIGIALGGARYDRPEAVLRDADTALHRAKADGKARHRIFDTPMHVAAVEHLELENDLRRALERDELRLAYQPIIELRHGRIVGFEALLRWQHPERGLLLPSQFVPLAEETGLIMALGDWVLRESCRQLQAWDREPGGASGLSVTVNLSAREMAQRDLVERVASALGAAGIDPSRLKIEVTESVIVENPEATAEILAGIKALGCQICLDDFGTGYSSLSYLLRLPIDVIKVDRSFLVDIGRGTRNADIVWAVLALAKRLGMEVIAEGVETPSQVLHLRELECGFAQGYYFCRPVAADSAADIAQQGFVPLPGATN